MIEFRLQQVGRARGIVNGYQLLVALKRVGKEIAPASAHRLWRNAPAQSSIVFETLDYLCDALDCQPGDLLVHVKKKQKK